ncbi:MAG: sensor histidine kinase [Clostridiales bacterium]|nr:sensor histidine kinase [Clostridiales bacterium]
MSFLDFFNAYIVLVFGFMLGYSVLCALTLRKLDRRDGFWWKVLIGIVVLLVAGIPDSVLYVYQGETFWGRALVYLFLFAVFVFVSKLCYRESYITLLFCCSIAYAAQNLAYNVYLVIWTGGEALSLYEKMGKFWNIYSYLVFILVNAGMIVATWFLFIRRITQRLKSRKLDYRMLIITAIALLVTIVLSSIEDLSFAKLSVDREHHFAEPLYYVLSQTSNALSVVCCITVLLLASKSIVEHELLQEVEYLKFAVRQGERQYQISKDTIELINVKCHDLKYRLEALTKGGASPEEIEQFRESIMIYDTRLETGNQLLNVLLTEKSLYCEQNGITLTCLIDGEKLDFLEVGDLYCLFGNLIDNALEAVRGIEDKDRRIINISVKKKGDLIILQEENYYDGEITFEDGLPVTTKKDKDYHGFGMRSIKMIVNKVGGELTSFAADGVFHLNIIFSR